MKITKQINNYSCVLACLESFLAERGRSVTQKELIEKFPDLCHKGEKIEGAFAASPQSLKTVGEELGLSAEFSHEYHVPSGQETYFIVTTEGDKHCVRVESNLVNGKFRVMDPNRNRDNDREELFEFDFDLEASRKPVFLRIKEF